jgi:hypothetical protein
VIPLLTGAIHALVQRVDHLTSLLDSNHPTPLVLQRTREILNILQDHRDSLRDLLFELEGPPSLLPNVLKLYNARAREVYQMEALVVGPLSRWREDDERMTALASKACQEIGFGDLPVVIATSGEYYQTLPKHGLILSPATESRGLLNLPDLFHELGHHWHYRQAPVYGRRAYAAVTAYLQSAQRDQQRLARPIPPDRIIAFARYWIDAWAEEVACDTFATILVGPAYGWANLHLILRQPTPFTWSLTHPADAARMDHILRVLRRIGLGEQADQVSEVWVNLQRSQGLRPPAEYVFLHPAEIFTAIAEDVEEAIDAARLARYDPSRAGLVRLLNQEGFIPRGLPRPVW